MKQTRKNQLILFNSIVCFVGGQQHLFHRADAIRLPPVRFLPRLGGSSHLYQVEIWGRKWKSHPCQWSAFPKPVHQQAAMGGCCSDSKAPAFPYRAERTLQWGPAARERQEKIGQPGTHRWYLLLQYFFQWGSIPVLPLGGTIESSSRFLGEVSLTLQS